MCLTLLSTNEITVLLLLKIDSLAFKCFLFIVSGTNIKFNFLKKGCRSGFKSFNFVKTIKVTLPWKKYIYWESFNHKLKDFYWNSVTHPTDAASRFSGTDVHLTKILWGVFRKRIIYMTYTRYACKLHSIKEGTHQMIVTTLLWQQRCVFGNHWNNIKHLTTSSTKSRQVWEIHFTARTYKSM